MASEQGFFTAFIENSDDITVLEDVAKELELKNCEILIGGIKEAIALYQGKKSPPYLMVDLSKSDLPISDMTRLVEVCSPNVSIIAIGTINEVSLYRDLSKLGIYEYLLIPLFPDILERTLRNMISGLSKEEGTTAKSGKIIACMGARGGVGTTFIASNLAAMLSSERLRRVVLVDLDPYFGTLSLNFDIKPNAGFRDAFENPTRIDPVFIDRLLTPINERLFILGTEESLQEKVNYKIEGLEEFLNYLPKQFHYVVVDVPHSFNELISTMLLKANINLLITEPSVAGLRDAGKITNFVNSLPGSRRSIIVMNKYNQNEKDELKIDEFEKVLKSKVNHTIFYNKLLPMEFLNQGKMMVNEKNPIADSIRNIMFDILGARQIKEEQKGWFKKLF